MGHYIPSTREEQRDILNAIGVESVAAFFAEVPPDVTDLTALEFGLIFGALEQAFEFSGSCFAVIRLTGSDHGTEKRTGSRRKRRIAARLMTTAGRRQIIFVLVGINLHISTDLAQIIHAADIFTGSRCRMNCGNCQSCAQSGHNQNRGNFGQSKIIFLHFSPVQKINFHR
jgi:hypothetical protein